MGKAMKVFLVSLGFELGDFILLIKLIRKKNIWCTIASLFVIVDMFKWERALQKESPKVLEEYYERKTVKAETKDIKEEADFQFGFHA